MITKTQDPGSRISGFAHATKSTKDEGHKMEKIYIRSRKISIIHQNFRIGTKHKYS